MNNEHSQWIEVECLFLQVVLQTRNTSVMVMGWLSGPGGVRWPLGNRVSGNFLNCWLVFKDRGVLVLSISCAPVAQMWTVGGSVTLHELYFKQQCCGVFKLPFLWFFFFFFMKRLWHHRKLLLSTLVPACFFLLKYWTLKLLNFIFCF